MAYRRGGSQLPPELLPTLSTPGSGPRTDPDNGSPRLLPGTRFGARYRIVELLGRGGAGEVYRADDLQLGQAVALKFLPRHLSEDPTALARLRNEVRVARQVSHANVCRVYDIGDVEGQCFLSMEYVDGEDLASVLRRLGRPTPEKALQIARQLCAGLAAAHEAGVLHRDLKPANVMIDGQGRVRITDFGLAALARELNDDDALAGTPGYMAPEQLSGRGVSSRSDIYSLGLVLYELFTGRAAFSARSLEELERQHRTAPASPSHIVTDVDPEVEQIVLRCLERDPRLRPASPLEVAAAFPGGDPLAEALAAGETPSPEVVAAAGGRGGLQRGVAVACLAGVIAGLALVWGWGTWLAATRLPALEKAPLVLADRSRDLLQRLGFSTPAADWAQGLWVYVDYLDHVRDTDRRPDRWERLAEQRPTAYRYWYRESPLTLVPWHVDHWVNFADPPPRVVGMRRLVLDGAGRLQWLEWVPPQVDTSQPTERRVDVAALFDAAGLDIADFRESEPEWNPTRYADERRAWEGHYPGQADPPVRVEVAGYRGQPVYFGVIHPFDKAWLEPGSEQRTLTDRINYVLSLALTLGILGGALWFARRNLRRGSGDRRGALRLGVAVALASLLYDLLQTNPTALRDANLDLILPKLALALFFGFVTACAYLAVEPYARRQWPETLITWTRVLLGRFRDPRVGRDILVGGLAGLSVLLLQGLERLVPTWLGAPTRSPWGVSILGGADAVAHLVDADVLAWPTFMLLILTGMRFLLRRPWLAIVASLTLMVLLDGYWYGTESISRIAFAAALGESILVWALLLFVLVRFGLFAEVVAFFFVARMQHWPFTLDPSVWYAGTSFLLLGILLLLALYGFRISLGAGRAAPFAERLTPSR